jgi:hypothetical protein
MAATFYAEPVLTFDLDIFVLLPSQAGAVLTLTPLYEDLRRRGYAEEGECVTIEGVPVQFLPAYNALIEEAVSQACDTPYEQTPTRVLRAEHLIAIARPGEGPAPRTSADGTHANRSYVSRRDTRPSRLGDHMETVDPLRLEIARIIAAKERRRRQLAALSFPAKVRLVVQLQQTAAPLLRARGRRIQVWQVDATPPLQGQ